MGLQHIFIKSYYSEDDNADDGIYSINYPINMNIRSKIREAYVALVEAGEPTGSLSFMLDYLIKHGCEIDYIVLNVSAFDCAYGTFN